MTITHNYPGPTILEKIKIGLDPYRRVSICLYRFADGNTSIWIDTGAMMIQTTATRQNLEDLRDAINSAIKQDIADEAMVPA